MAYVNQEKKAKINTALKAALKGTDVKYTLAVRNHSKIVCTIKSSSIDFIGNFNSKNKNKVTDHIQVNHYYIDDFFSGDAASVLTKIKNALNLDNYNNSDSQSDYFDVGHYITIDIGKWDKPYVLN